MAKLRLSRRRAESGDLPPYCLRCGAPADLVLDKTFSWHHPAIDGLIAFGPVFAGLPCIVGIILLVATSKRLRVAVPLCQRHKYHWVLRYSFIWISLGPPLAALFLAAILLLYSDKLPPDLRHVGVFVLVAGALLMFAWLITAVVLHNNAIRAKEITDRGITLIKVSPEFVRRFERQREEEQFDGDFDEPPEAAEGEPRKPNIHIRRAAPEDEDLSSEE